MLPSVVSKLTSMKEIIRISSLKKCFDGKRYQLGEKSTTDKILFPSVCISVEISKLTLVLFFGGFFLLLILLNLTFLIFFLKLFLLMKQILTSLLRRHPFFLNFLITAFIPPQYHQVICS